MLHVGVRNNKHAAWKDKGAVSKSYLPCGDTGERHSCDELPEKGNKRRADGGREHEVTAVHGPRFETEQEAPV